MNATGSAELLRQNKFRKLTRKVHNYSVRKPWALGRQPHGKVWEVGEARWIG
jgi:hypothetical protein